LVRRGEVVLDFDVIDNWNNELDKMNDGKEGASYRYSESFVQLLEYMRAYFHLPYRQTEGAVKAHSSKKVPSIPDYSTINRRVNKLDVKINERVGNNNIVIALDSTGIKATNREVSGCLINGECKKRLLKDTYVAVDIKKKKILSLQVTSEEVHDGNRLKKLVDNASENNIDVKRVIADGAYDSKENFRYLFDNDIEAAIKVRKNSSSTSMNCCYPRKVTILEQLKDFKKWKNSISYGYRWMAETVFSSMKRMFGEYICISQKISEHGQ
jgi:hypothetical protein